MRLSEPSGKGLLKKYYLNVPNGFVVKSIEQARNAAENLDKKVVVKAMIPVGGRGKAGLVKIASDPDMAAEMSKQILGKTHAGYTVDKLIVEEAIQIQREFYFAVILDDRLHAPVLIFSPKGGVDIEQVAEKTPELIVKFPVCPDNGFIPIPIVESLINFGISSSLARKLDKFGRTLARIYCREDLLLAEVNPLVLNESSQLVAADCKMELDDTVIAKHPQYKSQLENTLQPIEREVKAIGGTLVHLEGGDIGVICNGAGMGMAIIDMLNNLNLKPANFLDTGGGTTRQRITAICQLMFKKKNLRGVIINLWGSITILDEVALGIVDVWNEIKPSYPVVARLIGNNQDKAMDILEKAGIKTARVFRTEEAVSILAHEIARRLT
jgi:succinyl-CoA synthetase beta subunit